MIYLIILMSAFFIGCETFTIVPNDEVPPIVVTPEEPPPLRIPLYWENTTEPHPERAPWSDTVTAQAKNYIAIFDSADDITFFCPNYKALNTEQKQKAIGELFVAVTYYESAFNPDTLYRECSKSKCQYSSGCQYHSTYGYCMKGGHKLDGGIVISRGLLQLSLQSSQGYGCQVSTPSDLHDPQKNLICGFKIMTHQITKKGGISVNSNYWAVLKTGGKYNKLSDIRSRVLKHAPACKK